MGSAVDWQKELIKLISDLPIDIYNPRRDDWDSSWTQSINNPQFFQQVTWEMNHIEAADLVVVYFAPNSKSPITLLELGLIAPKKLAVVCCPEGFWRKGDVDIVCQRHCVPMVDDLKALAQYVRFHVDTVIKQCVS